MRIFLSHSGRDKPLMREIWRLLPPNISAWIDEKEIRLGQNVPQSIVRAIDSGSDFVVFFISPESIRSEWVRRELEWALEKEQSIGRVFVLPVTLDSESWSHLPMRFQDRRHLPCTDFTEAGVIAFTRKLAEELFALMSEPRSHEGGSLDLEESQQRRERVRTLAQRIADNQSACGEDARLTSERLELIVSRLDPHRKVELLALYEMLRGRFTAEHEDNFEKAAQLEITVEFAGGKTWPHRLDLTANPFAVLRHDYGLGNDTFLVRNVFLDGIARLTETDRRAMFAGFKIVRCEFGR